MTPAQCRAARAFLQWSQAQLAKAAGIGVTTVRQFELGKTEPRGVVLDAMKRALEAGGVVFSDGGVTPASDRL